MLVTIGQVALKEGKIVEQGTYSTLMAANDEFAAMMREFAAAKSDSEEKSNEGSPDKKGSSPDKGKCQSMCGRDG